MKKYYAYARVAVEPQRRSSKNLEYQLKDLRRLAKSYDITISKIFKEYGDGKSSIAQLTDILNGNKNIGILCTSIDRLSRNFSSVYPFLKAIEEGRLEIITPEKTFTSKSEDKFLLSFLLYCAECERSQMSQRIKRGLRAKKNSK